MVRVLRFVRETEGASAAEYALILAIVATAVTGAAIVLGDSISTAFSLIGACISTGTASACQDM
jgi:pilus assembly protein Flp/PilA